jgi:hypothetical protein
MGRLTFWVVSTWLCHGIRPGATCIVTDAGWPTVLGTAGS